MHELALSVENTPIAPPTSIAHITFPDLGVGLFQYGANILIVLGILLGMWYLLWAGIHWVMSEGSKEAVTNAKDRVKYVVIGITIILGSFLVASVFKQFFAIH